jgi:hypothetical protein
MFLIEFYVRVVPDIVFIFPGRRWLIDSQKLLELI